MTLADLLLNPGFLSRQTLHFLCALEKMADALKGSPASQLQFFDFGEVDGVPHRVIFQVVPQYLMDAVEAQVTGQATPPPPGEPCPNCVPGELPPPEIDEDDVPVLDAAAAIIAEKVLGTSGCYVIDRNDFYLTITADLRVRNRLQRAIENK